MSKYTHPEFEYVRELSEGWTEVFAGKQPRKPLTDVYLIDQIEAVVAAGTKPRYETRNGFIYEISAIVPPKPSLFDLMMKHHIGPMMAKVSEDMLPSGFEFKPEPILTTTKLSGSFVVSEQMAYPERFIHVPRIYTKRERIARWWHQQSMALRHRLATRLLGYEPEDDY